MKTALCTVIFELRGDSSRKVIELNTHTQTGLVL